MKHPGIRRDIRALIYAAGQASGRSRVQIANGTQIQNDDQLISPSVPSSATGCSYEMSTARYVALILLAVTLQVPRYMIGLPGLPNRRG